MPIPGVADRKYDLAAFTPHRQPDAAVRLGVLCRVVHQVGEHLREPGKVGLDAQRRLAQRHREPVGACVDQRPCRFNRRRNDLGDVDVGDAQCDLALRDTGDVEQIVDEPAQKPDLTADHLFRPA
jgi:hypothetical protein